MSILADHFAMLHYFASPTFRGIVRFKLGTDTTEHNTFRVIRNAGSSYISLTKTKPLSLLKKVTGQSHSHNSIYSVFTKEWCSFKS
jgi:hypothetical protein